MITQFLNYYKEHVKQTKRGFNRKNLSKKDELIQSEQIKLIEDYFKKQHISFKQQIELRDILKERQQKEVNNLDRKLTALGILLLVFLNAIITKVVTDFFDYFYIITVITILILFYIWVSTRQILIPSIVSFLTGEKANLIERLDETIIKQLND